VLPPQIFTRPTSPIICISSRTWGDGRPQVGLCPIFLVFLAPSEIAAKLRHVISISVDFIMQVQKFGGPSPRKKLGPKHAKYPKSERYVIENNASRVQRKKSCELWSTIHIVVHVSLDPPKSTFSGYYISAPMGCWRLKFLHTLVIDKVLLAHIANRVGGPLKNFKGQHLKLGLKFHIIMRVYNYGDSVRNL